MIEGGEDMKRFIIVTIGLVIGSFAARAGEIFGTFSEGTKPVAAGVKVEIVAGESVYKGETDKFGGYRLVVAEKGKVVLRVVYKGQPASIEVASFDKSLRYDLILESVNGKYTLRRK
jgi:hypothetical protein